MDSQRELWLSGSGSQEIFHSAGFFVGSSGLEAFRVVNDVWKTWSRNLFLYIMRLMCIGIDLRLDLTISNESCFAEGDVHICL
jgi:hypothetical protein